MWGGDQDLIEATARRRHRLNQRPIGVAELAPAVLFLASAEARRITGASLNVDDGYTLG
jgi:NAD(P)-dependent dehydrogenase (short-subunit alcohol dehydrogenase family)